MCLINFWSSKLVLFFITVQWEENIFHYIVSTETMKRYRSDTSLICILIS